MKFGTELVYDIINDIRGGYPILRSKVKVKIQNGRQVAY